MSNTQKSKDALLRAALKRQILRDRKLEKERIQRVHTEVRKNLRCNIRPVEGLNLTMKTDQTNVSKGPVQDEVITSSDDVCPIFNHTLADRNPFCCKRVFVLFEARCCRQKNAATATHDNRHIFRLPKVEFPLQHSGRCPALIPNSYSNSARLN